MELSGWMTMIGGDLCLLEDDYGEDFRQAPRRRVSDQRVLYALIDVVEPLGGECFLFHRFRAKVLQSQTGNDEVSLQELWVEQGDRGNLGQVDLSDDNLDRAFQKNRNYFSFDLHEEMNRFKVE